MSSWRSQLLGLAFLGFVAWQALGGFAPPLPLPLTAPLDEFSAWRAQRHFTWLSSRPHPVGTPQHDAVQQQLVEVLTQMGLTTTVQETTVSQTSAGRATAARVRNVVAVLPGKGHTEKALLLSAHYDAVPQSLGASDDGSGVVTLLETARALKRDPPLQNDVIFLFSDAEEMGLLGAQAFVAEHPLWPRVALDLNFEARGSRGAVTLFDTAPGNSKLISALASTPQPVASSLISTLARILPNDTDASVFKHHHAHIMSFAYATGLEHYHRRTDSYDQMDLASVQHDGSYALALARHFGNADLADLDGGESVYVDLAGRFLVRYPRWLTYVLAVVALGVWLQLGRQLRAAKALRGAALGAALMVVGTALAVGVASQLGRLLLGRLDAFQQIAHGGMITDTLLLASGALLVTLAHFALRRGDPRGMAYGALGLWTALVLGVTVYEPAASPPFLLALAGSLGGLWWSWREPGTDRSRVALWVGAAPGVLLMTAVMHAVGVAAGPALVAGPVLFLGLLSGLLVLPLSDLDGTVRAGVVAMALLYTGLDGVDAIKPDTYGTNWPMANLLNYGVDTETRTGRWLAGTAPMDGWVQSVLGMSAAQAPQPAYSRSPAAVWSAPAPMTARLPPPPPTFDWVSDTTGAGGRVLTLRLTVSRADRCLQLWDEGGAAIQGAQVDGKPMHERIRFTPEKDEALFRTLTHDDTPRRWHLDLCGVGGAPIDVALTAEPGAPVKLRVLEVIDGIPEDVARARPDSFVPNQWSDNTLITHLLTR